MIKKLAWVVVSCVAALSLAVVAGIVNPQEKVNALWLVVAAACFYAVAYRFYGRFLTAKVLALDPNLPTPARRLADGMDFHPTNRWVLFGHHFAAIAGAGPLIGPMLAAQFGYLPGFLWLLIGAVLVGAVHDVVILAASVRRNGRSLAQIAKDEGIVERHVRFLAPLAFVSPRIIKAIFDGDAPADLTVTQLAKALPYSWAQQEQRLGMSCES